MVNRSSDSEGSREGKEDTMPKPRPRNEYVARGWKIARAMTNAVKEGRRPSSYGDDGKRVDVIGLNAEIINFPPNL